MIRKILILITLSNVLLFSSELKKENKYFFQIDIGNKENSFVSSYKKEDILYDLAYSYWKTGEKYSIGINKYLMEGKYNLLLGSGISYKKNQIKLNMKTSIDTYQPLIKEKNLYYYLRGEYSTEEKEYQLLSRIIQDKIALDLVYQKSETYKKKSMIFNYKLDDIKSMRLGIDSKKNVFIGFTINTF